MMSDDYKDEFFAFRMAFRNWPKLPDPLALRHISGSFPDDWRFGKVMQSAVGGIRVPWKTECEIGAGAWHRYTNGAWLELEDETVREKVREIEARFSESA